MTDNSKEFKPFISADKILPEFTVTSLIIGILLAIIFGAANAYLGLNVGMTISASIPAAVISMGIIRVIMGRDSILENNMVQTIGSAGEALAAGAIFTLPALFMWADEWGKADPSIITIAVITLCGGILGTLFMIPLRRALIVNEHGVLPYPEGTACAEVLEAGEEGGLKAAITFLGLGVGAIYKFIVDGLRVFPNEIETEINVVDDYKNAAIGIDVFPALLGVGFIIGPRISAYMLGGAVLGWLGIIPLITYFGDLTNNVLLFPASGDEYLDTLSYWSIWSYYLRYIGAGAVAFGGFMGLIKSLPLIIRSFSKAMKGLKKGTGADGNIRTQQDLPLKVIIIGSLAVVVAMAMLPIIPVGWVGAIIIAILGFFFAAVSSRIVGIVGSSSNPVSGMTIATIIITAIIFKATGNDGQTGMIAVLTVGAVICVIAAIAGDISQDLKTGYLVGATPKKQQIGEIVGVVASALAIGGVLILLNEGFGFGSAEGQLRAPQANLMKMVIEGIMGEELPWIFILTGVGIGLALELFGLPTLTIAIGLYLPIHLSTPIMVGGLVRGAFDYLQKSKKEAKAQNAKAAIDKGILYSSGLIAGEGLIGIILAVLAVIKIDETSLLDRISLTDTLNLGDFAPWLSLICFILLAITLIFFSAFYKAKKKAS